MGGGRRRGLRRRRCWRTRGAGPPLLVGDGPRRWWSSWPSVRLWLRLDALPPVGVERHRGSLRGAFSGGSHGFVIGHVTPEAYLGGPLAIVKNGDPIEIDAEKRTINLVLSKKEIDKRFKAWKQPKPRYTGGVLAKYASQVKSASLGAVTD